MEKRIILLVLVFSLLGSAVPIYAEYQNEPSVNIYPNPATVYLKVEFRTDNPIVPEIKIYDLTGKVIKDFEREFVLNQEVFKADLDISDLNKGIYFVKVIQGENVYTRKLLVS